LLGINIKLINRWLKQEGITCSLAKWVVDLLPTHFASETGRVYSKRQILAVAAICGTVMAEKVQLGQVSFYNKPKAEVWSVHFHTLREAKLLEKFGEECYLTKPASILRTAIMMGLRLPRVELGVMSQTRVEVLTTEELENLVTEAGRTTYG